MTGFDAGHSNQRQKETAVCFKLPLSLLVVAAAVLWCPKWALSQAPTSLKERWKLELLPEKVPRCADISGTAWAQHGQKNILGAGTDFAYEFPVPDAISDPRPRVHVTEIRYPSVNNRSSPIIETTEKYRVTIDGPFLEYGGLVRCFFASKDDRLVLDAAIRVEDRKWYRLRSRHVIKDRKPTGEVEITEYLFEFQHDPLIEDHGDVTVHSHVRILQHDRGVILHTPWKFEVDRQPNRGKYCSVKVVGQTLTFFDEKGQYATVGENDAFGGTGVFRKLPEAQPAQRNP